jgi:hypothetical protein
LARDLRESSTNRKRPGSSGEETVKPEIPLQTLVRDRLMQLITAASAEDHRFAYGFLLHGRADDQGTVFGIITSGGESLVVTGAMLATLERELCWAYGAVPIRFQAVADTRADRPVRELVVLVPDGVLRDAELRDYCPAHGRVSARELPEPLVLLTASRPAGWPC